MEHATVPGHIEAVWKHGLNFCQEAGKSLWKLALAERIVQPQRKALWLTNVLT